MSTSDLANAASSGTSLVDLTGASLAKSSGLPDPAVLSRMATEMFRGVLSPGPVSSTLAGGAPVVSAGGVNTAQGLVLPASAGAAGVPGLESAEQGATSAATPGASALPGVTGASVPAGVAAGRGVSAPAGATVPGSAMAGPTGVVRGLPSGVPAGFGRVPGVNGLHGVPGVAGVPGVNGVAGAPAVPGVQAVPGLHGANGSDGGLVFLRDARPIFDTGLASSAGADSAAGHAAVPGADVPGFLRTSRGVAGHAASGDATAAQGLAVERNVAAAPLPMVSQSLSDFSTVEHGDGVRSVASVAGPVTPLVVAAPAQRGGPGGVGVAGTFDVRSVRRDFPILEQRINGRPLIWLDNAATTQKPRAVIDAISHFYENDNSNIHRAAHPLAARATDAYERARRIVADFFNVGDGFGQVIFVRGATEGINLVAGAWGRANISAGDEIVVTHLEHHANIVPWQMLCAEKGARLRVAPVDDTGQVILAEYEKLFGPRTKLAAIAHVSNALGTVTPVEEMTRIAQAHGAKVLVDGAQSVSHMAVDVAAIGCDFFVFSGHKVFAPTGIGVVIGRTDVLQNMLPWQGGGNMIADVTFEKTVYQPSPMRFEAGTGNIADAIGLGAALEYLSCVGMDNVERHEQSLITYATHSLRAIPGLRIIGTAKEKAGVVSFVLDGMRTEEVGAELGRRGIAVRSGHHCAQPILRRFGVESTVRPSFALYNTFEEIDQLAAAVRAIRSGRSVTPV